MIRRWLKKTGWHRQGFGEVKWENFNCQNGRGNFLSWWTNRLYFLIYIWLSFSESFPQSVNLILAEKVGKNTLTLKYFVFNHVCLVPYKHSLRSGVILGTTDIIRILVKVSKSMISCSPHFFSCILLGDLKALLNSVLCIYINKN